MPRSTPYPFGPLSLYQLDYWLAAFERYPQARPRAGEDAYDYGVRRVAEAGVYPTFGHVDNRHGRWYADVRAREGEFAITR